MFRELPAVGKQVMMSEQCANKTGTEAARMRTRGPQDAEALLVADSIVETRPEARDHRQGGGCEIPILPEVRKEHPYTLSPDSFSLNSQQWFWAITIVVIAGLLRLVPHPWNLTPVGALGLFAGGRLRSWLAYAVPLLVMIVTDAILVLPYTRMGLPSVTWATPLIYASFLLNVLLGRWLCRTNGILNLGTASVLASVQFFLVTNFAAWLISDGSNPIFTVSYDRSLEGLLKCYAMGLAFFGSTIAGDLIYTFGFCYAYTWLTQPAAQTEARLES
jgi:hypothetical protein